MYKYENMNITLVLAFSEDSPSASGEKLWKKESAFDSLWRWIWARK